MESGIYVNYPPLGKVEPNFSELCKTSYNKKLKNIFLLYHMNIVPYIPNDLINIILEYDGRIKYRRGNYVNIIHKYDVRYDMIQSIINKKMEILKTAEIHGSGFYFEFGFDTCRNVGLCYDCNFSYADKFEICYYDTRNNGWIQIRTYL
jgi:hypothetical protein